MRVVQEPPPWTLRFTCRGCHAELEADAIDVVWYKGSASAYGCDPCFYVACCRCGTDYNFGPGQASALPADLKEAARARGKAKHGA